MDSEKYIGLDVQVLSPQILAIVLLGQAVEFSCTQLHGTATSRDSSTCQLRHYSAKALRCRARATIQHCVRKPGGQRRLLRLHPRRKFLSTNGKQIVVENSDHGIPEKAPDAVVGAIHEVVTEVRNRQNQ